MSPYFGLIFATECKYENKDQKDQKDTCLQETGLRAQNLLTVRTSKSTPLVELVCLFKEI